MKERIDPFERCKKDIIKILEDMGEKQKKPSLIDRITLPFDRRIYTLLARRMEISDDQIKGYLK